MIAWIKRALGFSPPVRPGQVFRATDALRFVRSPPPLGSAEENADPAAYMNPPRTFAVPGAWSYCMQIKDVSGQRVSYCSWALLCDVHPGCPLRPYWVSLKDDHWTILYHLENEIRWEKLVLFKEPYGYISDKQFRDELLALAREAIDVRRD